VRPTLKDCKVLSETLIFMLSFDNIFVTNYVLNLKQNVKVIDIILINHVCIYIYIVTYSGSVHDGTLLHSKKSIHYS
jgi:hypothetical protein